MPVAKGRARAAWLAAMPAVFVLLWSTGFIGAKLGLPDAEPMTFLAIRFVVVLVLLGAVAVASRAPWPRTAGEIGHIAVSGLLLQGVHLGSVFAAIHHGVGAGVAAVIVGVQPVLVAVAAGWVLRERVRPLQWLGFALGLAGVVLVVRDKLGAGLGAPLGYGFSVLALFSLAAGTLYQKRFCAHADLRTGNFIQFVAALVAVLPLALLFETMQVRWTPSFVFALAWLSVVLSVGAISLLFLLIRRGAAAKVASLFYLVPPCAAVMAYFLFGETLNAAMLAGMACAAAGVALVNWRRSAPPAQP
jgi:drug/metabolite transporter (DMT)-like permease